MRPPLIAAYGLFATLAMTVACDRSLGTAAAPVLDLSPPPGFREDPEFDQRTIRTIQGIRTSRGCRSPSLPMPVLSNGERPGGGRMKLLDRETCTFLIATGYWKRQRTNPTNAIPSADSTRARAMVGPLLQEILSSLTEADATPEVSEPEARREQVQGYMDMWVQDQTLFGFDIFKLKIGMRFDEVNGVIQPGGWCYRHRYTYDDDFEESGGQIVECHYTSYSYWEEANNEWTYVKEGGLLCDQGAGITLDGRLDYSTLWGFSVPVNPTWELDGSCDEDSIDFMWDPDGAEP